MFIPLHDGNPLRHVDRPYVTWTLIALTSLFHFAVSSDLVLGSEQAAAVSLGIVPSVVGGDKVLPAGLETVPPTGTLVTYAFLHGDVMHLLGNMLFLWVFGDNVEDAVGHVKFLAFYLLSAAAGGFLHLVMHPGSDVPLIGASGAVAGIIAAYLMLHPHVRLWVLALGRIPLRLKALWVLGFWVAFQLFNVLVDPDGQVSWWAHIGGLIGGAVLILVLRRPGVPLFDRGTNA